MLIEQQQRDPRVRFRYPVRLVTLDGPPRVIHALTANVSRQGLFVRMAQPLPPGSRVAMSFEASGRALAFAQGQVAWGRPEEDGSTPELPGCGVRFTSFLHPRASELVDYLVANLDQGRPLTLPRRGRAKQALRAVAKVTAAALGLSVVGAGSFWLASPHDGPPSDPGEAPLALVAVAPASLEALALVDPSVAAASPPAAEAPVPAPAAGQAGPNAPAVGEAQAPAAAPVAGADADPPAAPGAVLTPARGTLRLPSGAARRVLWTAEGSVVRLTPALVPGARLERARLLANPSRAVFDLSGQAPRRSHAVEAGGGHVAAVRVGRLGRGGTRVVVDLRASPRTATLEGQTLILAFE